MAGEVGWLAEMGWLTVSNTHRGENAAKDKKNKLATIWLKADVLWGHFQEFVFACCKFWYIFEPSLRTYLHYFLERSLHPDIRANNSSLTLYYKYLFWSLMCTSGSAIPHPHITNHVGNLALAAPPIIWNNHLILFRHISYTILSAFLFILYPFVKANTQAQSSQSETLDNRLISLWELNMNLHLKSAEYEGLHFSWIVPTF